MELPAGKQIYFASDFHLGIPDRDSSRARERRIVRWLEGIQDTAAHLFLVGDLFDVWFEYKQVVPKGYTRFLGKLAELSDGGLKIEAFTGNHDLWMRGYFEDELAIPVHHHPVERILGGKKFFIAHGDGLGPGDRGYKFIKKVFRSPFSQWLYRRLHPDTGVGMAGYFSRLGPKHEGEEEPRFLGPEREWLVQFCLDTLRREHFDYFVFGHRHLALEYDLPGGARYVNLGDWLRYDSYAAFDGTDLKLHYYRP